MSGPAGCVSRPQVAMPLATLGGGCAPGWRVQSGYQVGGCVGYSVCQVGACSEYRV